MSFAEGVEEGLIRFVGDDCKRALYDAIESRQVRPGLCKTAGLKLVYRPLNGSRLVPVTQILKDIGITDVTIVPELEYPNGYFTTYQLIGTVRAFHGNTNTVCIRVSSKHKICSCLLGKLQSLLQSCENLRIRVAACCKIAVRVLP